MAKILHIFIFDGLFANSRRLCLQHRASRAPLSQDGEEQRKKDED